MKNEGDITQSISAVNGEYLEEIKHVLQKHDFNPQNMLADIVAGICDVEVADMLSANDKLHFAQARWLFWFAFRYMSHETYERIADKTAIDGCKFSKDGIRKGIEKISSLIDSSPTWTGRWYAIRRIVKLLQNQNCCNDNFSEEKEYKVSISVPAGKKDSINVEIKEK